MYKGDAASVLLWPKNVVCNDTSAKRYISITQLFSQLSFVYKIADYLKSNDQVNYQVQFKPRAIKDLQSLPREIQNRILTKIERLNNNLTGDVKRLTNFTPKFRLRVGDYRVLFELEGNTVVIYRIKHRKNAYF